LLLKEALEDYKYYCLAKNFTEKTMINKRTEYQQMAKFLINKRGNTKLANITKYDMEAYLNTKRKKGLKAQSIVSMAKQVKAFFNWCVNEGYLEVSPMQDIILPNVPTILKTGLTKSEVQKLVNSFRDKDYFEQRNKAMIAIFADCGIRAIEARRIRDKDIKDNAILINGKGNKQRMVFISPSLKRIMLSYERAKRKYFKGKTKEDYYFLNYRGRGLSHAAVHNTVKEASERTGIEVHPHKFRHYYSVQAITGDNPIDIYSLSRLLGHSDISTTQRYLSTLGTDELLKKAMSVSPLSKF